MQVKLFSLNDPIGKKGQHQQNFEDAINQWLLQNRNVEIQEVKQSASGGSMGASLWLISVWYKETHGQ